jgi:hypothetical protein
MVFLALKIYVCNDGDHWPVLKTSNEDNNFILSLIIDCLLFNIQIIPAYLGREQVK